MESGIAAQALPGAQITGVCAVGRGAVAATVQGDGVVCHDLTVQRTPQTWALGGEQQFAAPAVFDAAAQRFYAATAGGGGAGGGASLLSWQRDAAGGSLRQLARVAPLPAAVHSLLPAGGGGPAELFAVFADGGAAACGPAGIVARSTELQGGRPVAASAEAGVLTLVVAGRPAGGGATVGSFRMRGAAELACVASSPLAPPGGGAAPLAAVCSAAGVAVFWSDGHLAAYAPPAAGSEEPVAPTFSRRLRGFALPAAAAATPAGRKRGAAAANGAALGPGAALAALGSGGLAVLAGWAEGGADAVRVVAFDLLYGGIQAAADLTAEELGLPPGRLQGRAGGALQAVGVRGSSGGSGGARAALAVGGCGVVLTLDLRPPTLAALLGALDVSAAVAGGAAAAAAAVLHPADPAVAARAADCGTALLAARPSLRAASPADDGGGLLTPVDATWPRQAAAVPPARRAAEDAAWAAGAPGAAPPSDEELDRVVAELLKRPAGGRTAAPLPPALHSRLLVLAAERARWSSLESLLAAQHPASLAALPGVAPSLAAAGRAAELHALLLGGGADAGELPARELAAVLRALLAPPASAAAAAARRAYAAAARVAGEAAVAAAEAAPGDAGARGAAAAAAAALDGVPASQLCLHPLLCSRRDAGALAAALRATSAAQAAALLRYLTRLLGNHLRSTGGAAAPAAALPPGLAAPPLAAVVEWAAAAVDANVTRLALRPDAAAACAALRAAVGAHVGGARALSRLRGALEHAAAGAPLPAAAAARPRYSVEWLDLRVK